ncbi:hypothetical protein NX02_p0430 (plasmid) [Sphingomonas sanxanigenens DSM 19645 = NX02]|uniref:Uncharacterized protein n=1 Tax=Sphingomonas sanxanigenens DSM 19645 = NX02 TaxID=1123269 RepID=A0A0F7JST3_9SPHN|nr:hypothetical protein NX02_p0430 [Sphingomonas sanxanigenens DSM 19645 = NX02]
MRMVPEKAGGTFKASSSADRSRGKTLRSLRRPGRDPSPPDLPRPRSHQVPVPASCPCRDSPTLWGPSSFHSPAK